MKKEPQNVKIIKDAIMDGYRRGVCNSEGDSLMDENNGRAIPKPKTYRATERYINGQWIKLR